MIVSYSASVVKIYYTTRNLARLKYFLLHTYVLRKTLQHLYYNAGVVDVNSELGGLSPGPNPTKHDFPHLV
jgi:hypothetical protein